MAVSCTVGAFWEREKYQMHVMELYSGSYWPRRHSVNSQS